MNSRVIIFLLAVVVLILCVTSANIKNKNMGKLVKYSVPIVLFVALIMCMSKTVEPYCPWPDPSSDAGDTLKRIEGSLSGGQNIDLKQNLRTALREEGRNIPELGPGAILGYDIPTSERNWATSVVGGDGNWGQSSGCPTAGATDVDLFRDLCENASRIRRSSDTLPGYGYSLDTVLDAMADNSSSSLNPNPMLLKDYIEKLYGDETGPQPITGIDQRAKLLLGRTITRDLSQRSGTFSEICSLCTMDIGNVNSEDYQEICGTLNDTIVSTYNNWANLGVVTGPSQGVEVIEGDITNPSRTVGCKLSNYDNYNPNAEIAENAMCQGPLTNNCDFAELDGVCDDYDALTLNDRCQSIGVGTGICRGDPMMTCSTGLGPPGTAQYGMAFQCGNVPGKNYLGQRDPAKANETCTGGATYTIAGDPSTYTVAPTSCLFTDCCSDPTISQNTCVEYLQAQTPSGQCPANYNARPSPAGIQCGRLGCSVNDCCEPIALSSQNVCRDPEATNYTDPILMPGGVNCGMYPDDSTCCIYGAAGKIYTTGAQYNTPDRQQAGLELGRYIIERINDDEVTSAINPSETYVSFNIYYVLEADENYIYVISGTDNVPARFPPSYITPRSGPGEAVLTIDGTRGPDEWRLAEPLIDAQLSKKLQFSSFITPGYYPLQYPSPVGLSVISRIGGFNASWNESTEFKTTDGANFYMDPDSSEASSDIAAAGGLSSYGFLTDSRCIDATTGDNKYVPECILPGQVVFTKEAQDPSGTTGTYNCMMVARITMTRVDYDTDVRQLESSTNPNPVLNQTRRGVMTVTGAPQVSFRVDGRRKDSSGSSENFKKMIFIPTLI